MSHKPEKKSDANKPWRKKRSGKSRKISPEYQLIVTEGTMTEPNYFSSMKELINSKYRERLQLVIEGEGQNTMSLVKQAEKLCIESPNDYKHVWIVYDKDDFPAESVNAVEIWCKANSNDNVTYHAIWSNECIELWYLLHFMFLQSNITRTEYYPMLTAELVKLGKGKYEKNREDMFDNLLPYIGTAIKYAEKLEEINIGKTPTDSAPGTKVHNLIKHMMPYITD